VTHPSEFKTNKAAGDKMDDDIKKLTQHDMSDDCPVCRTQDVVAMALMPAAAAWEMANELPRFSLALQGAAGLLGAMLEEGVDRTEIDSAISDLLDEIEAAIAEDRVMGGPPQGSA
jgi:hypothetical protein